MITTWLAANALCARTSRAAACSVVTEPRITTSAAHTVPNTPSRRCHWTRRAAMNVDWTTSSTTQPVITIAVHVQQEREWRSVEERTQVIGSRERPADQRQKQDADAEIEAAFETARCAGSRSRQGWRCCSS